MPTSRADAIGRRGPLPPALGERARHAAVVERSGHQSKRLLSRLQEGDVLEPALDLSPLASLL